MIDAEGLVAVVLLLFWIWALLDCIATDSAMCRNLPKPMWIILVLILPDIGALAWLLLGRPEKAQLAARLDRLRGAPPPGRPRGLAPLQRHAGRSPTAGRRSSTASSSVGSASRRRRSRRPRRRARRRPRAPSSTRGSSSSTSGRPRSGAASSRCASASSISASSSNANATSTSSSRARPSALSRSRPRSAGAARQPSPRRRAGTSRSTTR